jgi:hypothetical protein
MSGASRSYAGSKLDRLIQSRVAEIRGFKPGHLELFAEAIRREHPQTFQPPAKPGESAEDVEKRARAVSLGVATTVAQFLISSSAAAEYFGKEVDRLRELNSTAAFAVATCLAAYGAACNIPFDSSEGGFRRYFSGYFILRKSIGSLGMLQPWERFVAEMEGDHLSQSFSDESTEKLMTLAPQSESATLEKVLLGLIQLKESLRLIPGPVAMMTLPAVLNNPLVDDPWGKREPGPPPATPRTCTMCGGSGKRSCSACRGSGRVSRPGRDGQLDTTSCTVCYGSGRMRCDPCNGTGRR